MPEKQKSAVLRREVETKPSMKLRIFDALNGPLRMLPVVFALVVIWTIFTVINPSFMSPRNLTQLSVQIVNTGVMAGALFMVLLHGELDLSCAASGAVCATVGALLCITYQLPFVVAFVGCIATGALVGLIQGWIVTTFRAPAFIITMGTKMALNGILLILLTDINQISLVGSPMSALTTQYMPMWMSYVVLMVGVAILFLLSFSSYRKAKAHGLKTSLLQKVILPAALVLAAGIVVLEVMRRYRGVSYSVLALLGLLAVLYFVLTQTRFGIHLYALGGNPEAVRRAGISVKNTKWAAFVISGAIVAFAGFISASRVQGVSVSSIDENVMMNSLAACVLGGASLAGGKGNVWGIILGALVMGSLTNGLYLIGAETSVRLLLQGAILVLSIVLDSVIAKSTTH